MASAKVRVYELSKALDVSNKQVLTVLEKQFGVALKSHSSSVEPDVASKVEAYFRNGGSKPKSTPAAEGKPAPVTAPPKAEPTPAAPAKPEPKAEVPTQKPEQKAPSSLAPQAQQRPAQPSNQPPTNRPQSQPQPSGRPGQPASRPQQQAQGQRPGGSPSNQPAGVRPQQPKTVVKVGASPGAPPQQPVQRTVVSVGGGNRPQRYRPGQAVQPGAPGSPTGGSRPQRYRPGQPGQQGQGAPGSPTGSRPQRYQPGQQQEGRPPRQGAPGQPRPPRPDGPRGDRPPRRDDGPPRPGAGRPNARPTSAPAPSVAPEPDFPPSSKPMPRGASKEREKEKSKKDRLFEDDSSSRKPMIYKPTQQAPTGRRGKGGKKDKNKERPVKVEPEVIEKPELVEVTKPLSVREVAVLFHVSETEIIKQLFMKGVMVTINHILDYDAIKAVGEALDIEVIIEDGGKSDETEVASIFDKKASDTSADEEGLEARAPVISIMGHVDHGKTSLLDAIRETRQKIVEGEAGGITQSIGAYSVEKDGKRIVFLDTPGHEAFTAMRMRGAQATDIAILVVAADDGVMPQTKEAISHAKAAGIPIIVAVNKIDKEDADPDRVLSELSEHGLVTEKWGGETLSVEVSALQKLGIEDLLENILLVSEIQQPQANPNALAEGVIIEAQLDKGKGPVASALVQKGTLRVGDNLLVGSVGGRVRALIDDQGNRLKEAGPSTPVEILGLNDVPTAGEVFRVPESEKAFKAALTTAQGEEREKKMATRARATGGLTRSLDDENRKELRIVLKADSQGSLEAINAAFTNLNTAEVQVNVLHSATGDITETDVMLASASDAVILGFNVREDVKAERVREQEEVIVNSFDVIYHLIERVEKLMLGRLDAEIHVIETGKAEVRQLFNVGKSVAAGCMVTEGKLVRNGSIEVMRGGKAVHETKLDILRRFKDDVKEVSQGFECGIMTSRFNDWQDGDIIVCRIEEERERTSL